MLRLITPPESRSLPEPGSLLPSAPRRPGELLERVDVADPLRSALLSASSGADVPVDVAATLIWEGALLLHRLERAGAPLGPKLLDEAAAQGQVRHALSAAEADYLRALTQRRWRRRGVTVAVPIRLLGRLEADELEIAVNVSALRRAVAWEAAAILDGSTMAEWGITVALGAR